MKRGCGCSGTGEYFASNGMGEYFASNGMGEYFAANGMGGMGEYFASNGMGEYFASNGLGADEPSPVTPDPQKIAVVLGTVALLGVAIWAIFHMEKLESA